MMCDVEWTCLLQLIPKEAAQMQCIAFHHLHFVAGKTVELHQPVPVWQHIGPRRFTAQVYAQLMHIAGKYKKPSMHVVGFVPISTVHVIFIFITMTKSNVFNHGCAQHPEQRLWLLVSRMMLSYRQIPGLYGRDPIYAIVTRQKLVNQSYGRYTDHEPVTTGCWTHQHGSGYCHAWLLLHLVNDCLQCSHPVIGSCSHVVLRAVVLEAAGIDQPRALAVAYKNRDQLVHTVHSLREHYPKVGAWLCSPLWLLGTTVIGLFVLYSCKYKLHPDRPVFLQQMSMTAEQARAS